MNIFLRLNEGIVHLHVFDSIRVAERGGQRILVGSISASPIEHVLAYFAEQPSGKGDYGEMLLERVMGLILAESPVSANVVDCRDFTVAPTDQMQADIAMLDEAEEAERIDPTPPRQGLPRLIVRLKRGESMPRELLALKGRRVTIVEMAQDIVALICDEE